MRRPRLHRLRPAVLLAAPLLIVLAAACGSSTNGAAGADRPTGTAAPPPTSAPTAWKTTPARVILPIPTGGAPGPTCVQGWLSVTPGSDDYQSAALLLPQIDGAKVVRVFTGPLPGTGTGLHVYARTDNGRFLAVQMGDGPAVVFTAAGDTENWRPADWHRTGAAPQPSASTAALLPPSQAGCLDGS